MGHKRYWEKPLETIIEKVRKEEGPLVQRLREVLIEDLQYHVPDTFEELRSTLHRYLEYINEIERLLFVKSRKD